MKKTYIIPSLRWHDVDAESDLLASTIVSAEYDGDHYIGVGGDAEEGTSDSRRFNVWDDEDF